MYPFLSQLLSDRKGGVVFSCFGVWHWLYLLVIFGAIALVLFRLKGRSAQAKDRAVRGAISCAFGLYIADFFLMPFAYGEIDLEKLPFHICTVTCVLCFLSRHNAFLGRFRTSFAVLGLASNLIYVIYPAGVGWYQIHPLSYRVVQTLLFHGLMTAYGLFVLAFEEEKLEWKHCRRELVILVGMVVWAVLGNTLYNGTYGDYDHFFNWFFVVRDPFYLLSEAVAPYIMPFVIVLVMFAAVLLVYLAYFALRKGLGRKA